MGRVWVLDTETKGTGAEMVPLDKALKVLNGVRSIVDVNVFVWQPKAQRWRLLTLDERRALWDRRELARSDRRP